MSSYQASWNSYTEGYINCIFALGFAGGSNGKESACHVGDLDSIPGSGRVPGEGNGYPLQYSCLENSMDRGDWQVTVHGVAKSWTMLSDFHFLFHLYLNTSWDITLLTKVHMVKAIVFLVVMYRFESGIIKKAECQRIDALELWCWKTLESPLNYKEIKPVNSKRIQPWIFIGRTDAEAPILWPPNVKNWLIWKDSDAGKDWRQEEKGTTEGEMVGWHHWLNGHEFE